MMNTSKKSRILLLLPVLALLAGLVLMVTGAALAVSGYSIEWWTVDGGGGSSAGGDFTLSGTIGQPDAGKLAGGDFTLNGGFWQCAAPVVTAPGIATSSGNIDLNWTGGTANIYRAINDPYFSPGAAYASGVSSVWPDPGAAGDPADNHTYIIRASSDCGESGDSQRLAEFDFALVPGS